MEHYTTNTKTTIQRDQPWGHIAFVLQSGNGDDLFKIMLKKNGADM